MSPETLWELGGTHGEAVRFERQDAIMLQGFRKRMQARVYEHRARWMMRRLSPFLRPGERVLDIGAGDCRLDLMLHQRLGCEVVPVDVANYNRTLLPLIVYDGINLPFRANSFDTVLLLFVLHHAEDPRSVLEEARRVGRRVIVFEDINASFWDRFTFRLFHRWLEWSQKIPRPFHEWSPEGWSQLAREVGFQEHWQGPIGRQLGYFASRHIAFVWDKVAVSVAKAA